MHKYLKYLSKAQLVVSCLTVFCLVEFNSQPCLAEELEAVMMTIDSQADSPVLSALRDYLSDMEVIFTMVEVDPGESSPNELKTNAPRIADDRNAVIVFWRNSEFPDKVFIYVDTNDGPHFMVRTIDRKMETRDSQYEATALIIRYAIQAILDGREVQSNEQESIDDTPSESDTIGDDTRIVHLEASLAYGLSMFSSDSLTVHGGRIGLAAFFEHFGILLAYRLVVPIQVGFEILDIKLNTHPVELGGAYRWRSGSLLFQVGTTVLMDWISWSITSNSTSVEPRSDTLNFRIGISPSVTLGWQAFNRVCLHVGVSADIFIYQRELLVNVNGEDDSIVSPWAVSPYFFGGVSFLVF